MYTILTILKSFTIICISGTSAAEVAQCVTCIVFAPQAEGWVVES